MIAGPTAAGKTEFACRLAKKLGGEIINADSMQVYNCLPILTAKPSKQELASVRHHLIGTVEPDVCYSVYRWLGDATKVFKQIKNRGGVPIFVGGTGLYFKALVEGIAKVPTIPAGVREKIRNQLKTKGAAYLHGRLAKQDEKIAKTINSQDGQRIARALEVIAATGCSLQFFQQQKSQSILAGQNVKKYLLMPPRAQLHEKISARSEKMVNNGAVNEVKNFLKLNLASDLPISKAIGISALKPYIMGECSKEQALADLKTATRRYAKRQCTWLNNQLSGGWEKIIA